MFQRKKRAAAKTYIIYDERAQGGNTDDAVVLDTADSIDEARESVRLMWPNGVIFEYEDDGSGDLTNQKQIN